MKPKPSSILMQVIEMVAVLYEEAQKKAMKLSQLINPNDFKDDGIDDVADDILGDDLIYMDH